MSARLDEQRSRKQIKQWDLSSAMTLGSGVRAKGILLQVRTRLSFATRKFLDIETGRLVLRVAETDVHDFHDVIEIVTITLREIDDMPVIPREVEDILAITSTERRRWLKDGRLQSAGTRMVKLRGRARKSTFHVFELHHIEDILDRDLATVWREQDALEAAENRRRATGKAALTRSRKRAQREAETYGSGELELTGWEDFELDGLLR